MVRIFFREEQRFSSFWMYLLVVIIFTIALAPTVVALYSQLILGVPYGEEPSTNESLLVLFIVLMIMFVVTILLFSKMKLVTEVKNEGFLYKYPPFIIKFKLIRKEEIEKYEVRKYGPIREYSGWGIRYSWGKSGRAYNVKGNIGLQLYMVDGKKILFGTQRGDAIRRAMDKMMKDEFHG